MAAGGWWVDKNAAGWKTTTNAVQAGERHPVGRRRRKQQTVSAGERASVGECRSLDPSKLNLVHSGVTRAETGRPARNQLTEWQ